MVKSKEHSWHRRDGYPVFERCVKRKLFDMRLTGISRLKKCGRMVLMLTPLLVGGSRLSFGQTYCLRQILDKIDTANPGLQQYALRTKASLLMGEASRAWAAPEVGAGLSEFPYPAGGTDGDPMARKMLMIRLEQMFPNVRKQRTEQDYYRSFSSQHGDDRATLQNILFAEAKTAYYEAVIAQHQLAVLAGQEKQLKLLIGIAADRLTYNTATTADIYKARAKLGDLHGTCVQLQSACEQAFVKLNSLMGRSFDAPLQVDTSLNLPSRISILEVDSAYVQQHRSDIRHTLDGIHSMALKQRIEASAAAPTFGVMADNMRMDGGTYMYGVMATVSIPIAPWSSKGYHAKTSALRYQVQAMEKQKDNQVREALEHVHKDWLALRAATQDLGILGREVLPAYRETYQANLNALSENTGNIYETLAAWNDLTEHEMEYYNKLGKLLKLRVMLETDMQSD